MGDEEADFRPERTDFKPVRAALRSERDDLRPKGQIEGLYHVGDELRSNRADFKPDRGGGKGLGGKDK